MTPQDTSSPVQFKTPAVRHLAWMLGAPTLLQHRDTLSLPPVEHSLERLARWDRSPAAAPARLLRAPERRLGLYFERLFEVMMTELLGWELLGRNLPVRDGSRTLGELDFVLRNPHTGEVEHHEIAVKFYLGHASIPRQPSPRPEECRWYGPNARDRLDIKTRRMLEHQSRLTERPEAREALMRAGIEPPVKRRVFMPGYLFYPIKHACPPPEQAPPDHLRGHWLYWDDLEPLDTRHWVPLLKPHWIGPWRQPDAPTAPFTDTGKSLEEARHHPRLFAELAHEPGLDAWVEVARYFVMPANWPDVPPASLEADRSRR